MTPFMTRVAELVGTPQQDPGQLAQGPTTVPRTRISERVATGTGADRHVALRSLAEQYVCEANAVLGSQREQLGLVDETLPSELAFTVTFGDAGARCSTTFADGRAVGRLVGTFDEGDDERELDGPDALPDLLVRLLETAPVQATRTAQPS